MSFLPDDCQQRQIDTTGIEIHQYMHVNPEKFRIDEIELEIKLPEGFPEKYKQAVIQAAQLCAVKKHLQDPPEFNIYTSSK